MSALLQDCLRFFNGRDNYVSADLKSYDLAVRVEAALAAPEGDSRPVAALATVWDALHEWEDGLFLEDPNSPPERADQVDEVKAAMAHIHEALGI